MAENGGGGGGGASISAAATAVGSAEARFPLPARQSRCGGCWSGLSCFGTQKRGKRIVPSSRAPELNGSANHGNGHQTVGLSNQTTTLTPSLLAPPSSPASFTNSTLPSTAQSPSCFLSMSANSPGGPSSTIFATGPYAHETQLVSPPVFSTFTTEPSTAPLTPPPELVHLTTPSSPEVPYAQFLSSSLDLKGSSKDNVVRFMSSGYAAGSNLRATYPLYPGSPSSSLISPVSGTPRTRLTSTFPERETPTQCDAASLSVHEIPYFRNRSSNLFGLDGPSSKNSMPSPDPSFFYSTSSAQFYLDQAQQSFPSYPHCGGRRSISREADVHISGNRHSKARKQDVEEIEAYRASFGFSADELITTQNYVEMSDVADDSFTMSPFANNNKPCTEPFPILGMNGMCETTGSDMVDTRSPKSTSDQSTRRLDVRVPEACDARAGLKLHSQSADISLFNGYNHSLSGDKLFSSKMWDKKICRSLRWGLSSSDAEIDYRRSTSSRGTPSS